MKDAIPLKQPLWEFDRKLLLISEEGHAYISELFSKYRPDVKTVLKDQQGADMAGFVARISADDLSDGEYRIGLYFISKKNGKPCVKYTDTFVKVAEGQIPVLRKEERA